MRFALALVVLVAACGGSKAPATPPIDAALPDATPLDPPTNPIATPTGSWHPCADSDVTGATVVLAHDHVNQNNGTPSTRNADVTPTFPSGAWSQIMLRVEVTCPDNFCDIWDRAASIALVEDEGPTLHRLELSRWMTAYGKGFCFTTDVTDLASHLQGKKTVRSFVDTWVSAMDNTNGHGWQVTTKFIFRPGTRDTTAYASDVIPLWNNQAEDKLIDIGDPTKPIATDVPTRTVTIPADAKHVKLRYFITGHGQGGADNCAEFCQLFYRTTIGLAHLDVLPWRDNCSANPVSPQNGTWKNTRAGWCPGAMVEPTLVDITDRVTPGTDTTVVFSIVDDKGAEFVNTCRTGAGNAQNVCTGCVASQGAGNCNENGNGHTPAQGRVSVQMLIYK